MFARCRQAASGSATLSSCPLAAMQGCALLNTPSRVLSQYGVTVPGNACAYVCVRGALRLRRRFLSLWRFGSSGLCSCATAAIAFLCSSLGLGLSIAWLLCIHTWEKPTVHPGISSPHSKIGSPCFKLAAGNLWSGKSCSNPTYREYGRARSRTLREKYSLQVLEHFRRTEDQAAGLPMRGVTSGVVRCSAPRTAANKRCEASVERRPAPERRSISLNLLLGFYPFGCFCGSASDSSCSRGCTTQQLGTARKESC